MLVAIAFMAPSDPVPTTATTPVAAPSDTASASPSPSLARVPTVEGLSLAKAKRKLRAAGLKVGEVDHRPSNEKKDTVLKQDVHKGTKLEPGSSVALVVAAPLPEVVSVVGKQKSSAVRKLEEAGFRVKKTTQIRTAGRDGVVLSQSPLAGIRAKPGSVVRIVVSNVRRSPETGEAIAHGATPRASLPRSTTTAVAAQAMDPSTPDRSESLARIPMS